MILIADTHAGKEGDLGKFFDMLKALENSTEDVVFLGDVFDLWVGVRGFERAEHTQFIAWCTEQRARRMVGFVEGNHEFFLTGYRDDCFSWCTDTVKRVDDLAFAHGDLINLGDVNYQRFRARMRTPGMRRLVRFMPFAPSIVQFVKRGTKKTNRKFRNLFPEDEIRAFAEKLAVDGVTHAFIGHFHTSYRTVEGGACTVHCIPGWYVNGEVARFDPGSGTVRVGSVGQFV